MDWYAANRHSTDCTPTLDELMVMSRSIRQPLPPIRKIITDDAEAVRACADPRVRLARLALFDNIIENKALADVGLEPGVYGVKGSTDIYIVMTPPPPENG